jgi:hypothetical protein
MSTQDNKQLLIEEVNISFNLERFVFIFELFYKDLDDKHISFHTIEILPFYDLSTDDYLFEATDTLVSLKQVVKGKQVDKCGTGDNNIFSSKYFYDSLDPNGGGGGAGIIGGGGGGALILAIICLMPEIVGFLEVVTTQIYNFFASIWNWFIGLFSSTTTTTTTYTPVYGYRIEIDNVVYLMSAVTTGAWSIISSDPNKIFYLAFANTVDTWVYVSNFPFGNVTKAASVLSASSMINYIDPNGVVSNSKKFMLSTYTLEKTDAIAAASQAGKIMFGFSCAYYGGCHDDSGSKKGTWFEHYHPGYDTTSSSHTAHSFYGISKLV